MKHKSLKSKIEHARPKLKVVSPLVYRICQGFIGVNLMIAAYFFFITTALKNTPLAITQGFIGFTAWGFVYLSSSILFAYSLKKNNWYLTRVALALGLTTKMMWTLALIILVFKGYPVFGVMILWLFLTWTQAWTLVHFLPVITWDGMGGESDDNR